MCESHASHLGLQELRLKTDRTYNQQILQHRSFLVVMRVSLFCCTVVQMVQIMLMLHEPYSIGANMQKGDLHPGHPLW